MSVDLRRFLVPLALIVSFCSALLLATRGAERLFSETEPRQYQELTRVTSPDGRWEAVMTTRSVHATVSIPTEVWLLAPGQPPQGEPVWLADHVREGKVAWTSADTIEITARSARTYQHQDHGPQGSKQVNITLQVSEPESF